MKLRVPGPFLIVALKRCAAPNRALRRAEALLFQGRDGFAEKAGRWCGRHSGRHFLLAPDLLCLPEWSVSVRRTVMRSRGIPCLLAAAAARQGVSVRTSSGEGRGENSSLRRWWCERAWGLSTARRDSRGESLHSAQDDTVEGKPIQKANRFAALRMTWW